LSPEEIEERKQRERDELVRERVERERKEFFGGIWKILAVPTIIVGGIIFAYVGGIIFANKWGTWRMREENKHAERGEETFKQAYSHFLKNYLSFKKTPTQEEFEKGMNNALNYMVTEENKKVHAKEKKVFESLVKHFGGMEEFDKKWNKIYGQGKDDEFIRENLEIK
jgi:hypothetical protein